VYAYIPIVKTRGFTLNFGKQGDKPFHWNGSTNGVTQSGVSNKLKVDKISTEIRRL